MNDDQINRMISRFLGWKLPENFSPDAGISFKAPYNENTRYTFKHEPTGTNLFNWAQADEMVRYMIASPAMSNDITNRLLELANDYALPDYATQSFQEAAAEIERLREALKPFADEVNSVRNKSLVFSPSIDSWPMGSNSLTLGDLRLALAALTQKPKP